jgi:hypothetical protein
MERVPSGWLAAIALTAVSILVGVSVTFVDEAVLGSDLTGTPLILVGGLMAVLAALAASGPSSLTDG